jgi:hypothetical protein
MDLSCLPGKRVRIVSDHIARGDRCRGVGTFDEAIAFRQGCEQSPFAGEHARHGSIVGAAFQAEPHVFSPTRLLSVLERGARRVDRCAERKQRAPDHLKAVVADIGFV